MKGRTTFTSASCLTRRSESSSCMARAAVSSLGGRLAHCSRRSASRPCWSWGRDRCQRWGS